MVYEYQERKRHMLRFSKVLDPRHQIASVRFAEKTSRNIISDDLLCEKNDVPTEKKQAEKDGL